VAVFSLPVFVCPGKSPRASTASRRLWLVPPKPCRHRRLELPWPGRGIKVNDRTPPLARDERAPTSGRFFLKSRLTLVPWSGVVRLGVGVGRATPCRIRRPAPRRALSLNLVTAGPVSPLASNSPAGVASQCIRLAGWEDTARTRALTSPAATRSHQHHAQRQQQHDDKHDELHDDFNDELHDAIDDDSRRAARAPEAQSAAASERSERGLPLPQPRPAP
jgi:hypothetical protein